MMSYRHLDEFLTRLEQAGEVTRVSAPVESDQEIAAITARVRALPASRSKALIFERVDGGDYPVVTNLFGTEKRMAWALGVESLAALGDRLASLLAMPDQAGGWLSRAGDMMALLRGPARVREADVQQIIHRGPKIDLARLPFLRHGAGEITRSITLAQITTTDGSTSRVTLGQAQVIGADAIALRRADLVHDNDTRRPIAAAIVLGGDPAAMWASGAPLPSRVHPYLLAGWLRGKPLRITPALTQPIDVLADAEVVIEGAIEFSSVVDPGLVDDGGGSLSQAGEHALMRVTAVTLRRGAVIPAAVPGLPPHDLTWLMQATEHLYRPLLRLLIEEVHDLHLADVGIGRNLAAVSTDHTAPGAVRKIMFALWGMGSLAQQKTLIVVDHDVDLRRPDALLCQIAEQVDPARDLVLVDGLLPGGRFGGKLGIDATRKQRPPDPTRAAVETVSGVVSGLIGDAWRIIAPGWLLIAADEPRHDSRSVIEAVRAAAPGWSLIAVDAGLNLDDRRAIAWHGLGRVDWRRDLRVYAAQGAVPAVVSIDLIRRDDQFLAAEIAPEGAAQVDQRWKTYGFKR